MNYYARDQWRKIDLGFAATNDDPKHRDTSLGTFLQTTDQGLEKIEIVAQTTWSIG